MWTAASRIGEPQRSIPALAAKARNLLARHGLDAAEREFWTVLDATTNPAGRGSHWLFSPDFAWALSADQRLEDLNRLIGRVEALTTRDPHPHNEAALALCSAYRFDLIGDVAAARSAFEDAVRRYAEMPCPARHAESLIGLATLEWHSNDASRSAEAANDALHIAETIGADGLATRAKEAVSLNAAPTVLATVLFTDIVQSTNRLSQVGDRAWGVLLERHSAVVRRELERFQGREINTTGDGFVAIFESPARAIRCALAIRDALDAVGIAIRAGLHVGECQLVGEDIVGIAVHVAARVSAEASPLEVLVSGTVRDLVSGSSFGFVERGTRSLRGVPGEWHLYAVSASKDSASRRA